MQLGLCIEVRETRHKTHVMERKLTKPTPRAELGNRVQRPTDTGGVPRALTRVTLPSLDSLPKAFLK